MTMTYNSLVAAKGVAGSIANWVNYSKIETNLPFILDEAQALIYTVLRVREMRTRFFFTLPANSSIVALPSRFLDPIGRVYCSSDNSFLEHKDDDYVLRTRSYEQSTGAITTDGFATQAGLTTVFVTLANHGMSVGGTIAFQGAALVAGVDMNRTFEIVALNGVNQFFVETDQIAAGSVFGGGSSITYEANNLTTGTPSCWTILDQNLEFNTASDINRSCYLRCFRSKPLLSPTNQVNFLTDRYPHMIREACLASAAGFMKDDAEYQKHTQTMVAMAQQAASMDDLMWTGADLSPEIP